MKAEETLKIISKQWCDLSDLMKLLGCGRNKALIVKKTIKDKNGMDRTNLSFFSARIYKEYFHKTNLKIGDEIFVMGIPKGYVDKNNYRQNYIHVLEINGIEISKEPDGDYWNGQKLEIKPPTPEEAKEFDDLLKEFM